MAMTRLSDPTPRMTLPRALLSEALRLARSPLTAVHLVCGLAAGLACGEYFSVTRWDPALGADAYAQFLGALMPLMSAIVCGLAVDEERAAGRLANLTAVPSRGRAVAAKLLALAALGAGALAVALGVFGAVLAVAGRLPLGPAPLAAAWAGIVLGSLPLYALGLGVALRLGRNAAIGAGAAGVLLAFFSVGGLAHGLMTGELTGALATPLSWVPLAWPARLGVARGGGLHRRRTRGGPSPHDCARWPRARPGTRRRPYRLVLPLRGREGRCVGGRSPPCSPSSPQRSSWAGMPCSTPAGGRCCARSPTACCPTQRSPCGRPRPRLRAGLWTAERGASTMQREFQEVEYGEDTGSG